MSFDPSMQELTVRGELDGGTAPRLARVDLSGQRVARFNLEAVTFVSAAGLTVLLELCRMQPTPTIASPSVRRLVEICELADVFVLQ